MDRFWCITSLFNPMGYHSRVDNYHVFRERLERQKVKLLTVELAFNDHEHMLAEDETVLHLRSDSIMWQKERLLNHAIKNLPPGCDRFAWLDSDLLLPDGWQDLLMGKLDGSDFVQMFESVAYLPPGEKRYEGERQDPRQGIVWQSKVYGENWKPLRLQRRITHAEPGFGWAARREALWGGLYDRLILGSGDNFLADCLLGSRELHHYWLKLTDHMMKDMQEWKSSFANGTVDYLPVQICHLWHGSVKGRAYHTRDLIFRQHDFNPRKDIKIVNNVWEWATEKPAFHQSIIDYFRNRKEDGEYSNEGQRQK